MEFKKSPVVFNEEDHSYFLGEKRLMGITGLIHSILGLGVYPEASDFVRGRKIPEAGSRGTAVHHAIQTYDVFGIKQALQTVPTVYYRGEPNEYTVEEHWDVGSQLNAYIYNMAAFGFEALANELTVSDERKWASQIDNVWRHKSTGDIWLVDTKTNNLKYYPLCGYHNPSYFGSAEEALKEYLSWQLSIYAELFERENPGIKVAGLACNWLREDNFAFWVIERKPKELVDELLSTDYTLESGNAQYSHPDVSVFGISPGLPSAPAPTLPGVPQNVVDYAASILRQEMLLKKEKEILMEGLRKAMEEHGVKSFDFGVFTATIGKDSRRTTLDSARLKKERPDLYENYSKTQDVKGSFTLKIKQQ